MTWLTILHYNTRGQLEGEDRIPLTSGRLLLTILYPQALL